MTLLCILLAAAVALLLATRVLRPRALALLAAPMEGEPLTMLWAWETPEDLTGLDTGRAGVAFLAREVMVVAQPNGRAEVVVRPRRQPLRVATGTWLMADVRIEIAAGDAVQDSPELVRRLTAAMLPATEMQGVRALQIDFDATAAQVMVYGDLLRSLRRQMPRGMPLSITALASWCGPKSWLPQLDGVVDEAVPMFFRMGGTPTLRATLPKDTSRVTQPLCAGSIGVATDETWPPLRDNERVYIFRTGPWTMDDLARLKASGPAGLSGVEPHASVTLSPGTSHLPGTEPAR
jgi:hypothetical protein